MKKFGFVVTTTARMTVFALAGFVFVGAVVTFAGEVMGKPATEHAGMELLAVCDATADYVEFVATEREAGVPIAELIDAIDGSSGPERAKKTMRKLAATTYATSLTPSKARRFYHAGCMGEPKASV
jgi:hypothetical protein